MKTKLMLTLICGLLFTGLHAQMGLTKNSTTNLVTSDAGIGNLIAQFTDNISSSAFTPEFLKNKKGWLEKATMTNDAKGAAWLLKSLQGGLNNSAFAATWAAKKDQWLAATSSIKTVKDAAGQLNSLSSNINPSMLSSTWNNVKPGWSSAVNSMAK